MTIKELLERFGKGEFNNEIREHVMAALGRLDALDEGASAPSADPPALVPDGEGTGVGDARDDLKDS